MEQFELLHLSRRLPSVTYVSSHRIRFTNLVLLGCHFSHKHVLYIPLIFRLITIWLPHPPQTYCGKRPGRRVSFWDLTVVSLRAVSDYFARFPLDAGSRYISFANDIIYTRVPLFNSSVSGPGAREEAIFYPGFRLPRFGSLHCLLHVNAIRLD